MKFVTCVKTNKYYKVFTCTLFCDCSSMPANLDVVYILLKKHQNRSEICSRNMCFSCNQKSEQKHSVLVYVDVIVLCIVWLKTCKNDMLLTPSFLKPSSWVIKPLFRAILWEWLIICDVSFYDKHEKYHTVNLKLFHRSSEQIIRAHFYPCLRNSRHSWTPWNGRTVCFMIFWTRSSRSLIFCMGSHKNWVLKLVDVLFYTRMHTHTRVCSSTATRKKRNCGCGAVCWMQIWT